LLPLLQLTITSLSLLETTNAVQGLLQTQSSEPQMDKLSMKTPGSDHKSSIELQLDALESKLRTVQLSLEILTGVCAMLPDPEPDLAEDQDEEGTSIFVRKLSNITYPILELEIDIDTDVAMGGQIEQFENYNASFLTTLVAPLLGLVQPTSLSFPPLSAQSIHPPTTSALSAIHIAALECLNNIFLSLATAPIPSVSAGLTVWNGLWSALQLVGTETGPGQERRQEFWEVTIGVLWGVGRVWKGSLVGGALQFDGTPLLIVFCLRFLTEKKSVF
jgi:hypothetical protein